MNDVAISFSDLGHAYRADRWVFRNHTAVIRKGRSFAVLGPNGRGKTTLLKILLGVLKPTAGSVQTNAAVAYVPQLFQVTFDYSVLDMVLMGRAKKIRLFSSPSANDRKIALQTLDRLGMGDLASHHFTNCLAVNDSLWSLLGRSLPKRVFCSLMSPLRPLT